MTQLIGLAPLKMQFVDHVFSGWTGRFYCDKSIPKYVLEELLKRGAEVIIMPEQGGFGGTMWGAQEMIITLIIL